MPARVLAAAAGLGVHGVFRPDVRRSLAGWISRTTTGTAGLRPA